MPSWVKNDDLWKKAKARVEQEYDIGEDNPRFYALVTSIYKKMGGEVAAKSLVLFMKAQGAISATMRKRIGTVGSEHREDMPADAFLLGKERKYPVKVKRDGQWVYSPILLEAAAKRARLQGREDLAARADKIQAGL